MSDLIRLVINAARADRITFIAASIAFYAVISIFPLLLLLLVVGSVFAGETLAQTVIDIAEGLFTPQVLLTLQDAIDSDTGRGGAGVVGVVVLVWSGLRVFRGLDIAFSVVYGTADQPSFIRSIIHSLIVLVALGAGMAIIVLVQTAGAMLQISGALAVFSPLLVLLALTILFYPLYFVFPGVTQSPTEVLPGTVFAAFGWTVLGELFGLYAAHAGAYALFGIVGAFLLLLMWFYFGAIILLVGVVINAVLADRCTDAAFETGVGVERPIGAAVEGTDDSDE